MLVERKKEKIDELMDLFGDEYIDNNLVFCSSNGRPMESQVINRAFNKLIKENGLPHVVFHQRRYWNCLKIPKLPHCSSSWQKLYKVPPSEEFLIRAIRTFWLLFHCSSSAADWAFLSGRTFRPTTVHTTCAHTQSWFCGSPAGCSCWALRASCSWSITIRSRWGR